MIRRLLLLFIWVLCLAGCSAMLPASPPLTQLPWRDQAFAYDPALVSITKDELFKLDPELLRTLQGSSIRSLPAYRRLDRLLNLIYGPERREFAYAAGHSTVAQETWQRKRGDCLSLTVLTYAAARVLGLPARVQDVDVPVLYDRRGTFDVLNHHVNVLFPGGARSQARQELSELQDVVVDFEPGYGRFRRGREVSEAGILARFYNNLGVEYLAAGNRRLAYAHFKAAATTDLAFAATYSNLAALYREAGMPQDAEQLLRAAVELSEPPDVALQALHRLLLDQGRTAEAEPIAARLASARERDPYYWIDLGVHQLQDGQYRSAVNALERAQEMATGFAEIHRYLALAYWRAGDAARAREQLAVLESLDDTDPGAMALRRKFKASPK